MPARLTERLLESTGQTQHRTKFAQKIADGVVEIKIGVVKNARKRTRNCAILARIAIELWKTSAENPRGRGFAVAVAFAFAVGFAVAVGFVVAVALDSAKY